MRRVATLVGEALSSATDPSALERHGPTSLALTGRVGRRLADLADLTYESYLRRFERRNLIDEAVRDWPVQKARERAAAMTLDLLRRPRVVLLGRRVAAAFRLQHTTREAYPVWTRLEDLEWFGSIMIGRSEWSVAPHPSGLSRWWNDSARVASARDFWRELAS